MKKHQVSRPNFRAALAAVIVQGLFIMAFVPDHLITAMFMVVLVAAFVGIVIFITMAEAFSETTEYTEAISSGEVDSDPDNDDDNRLGFVRKRARGRNA